MRWGRGKQFMTNQLQAWVSVVCVHCVHTPDMWSHPLQDPNRAGRAEPSLDCHCKMRALVGGICHYISLRCPWLPLPAAALGMPASPPFSCSEPPQERQPGRSLNGSGISSHLDHCCLLEWWEAVASTSQSSALALQIESRSEWVGDVNQGRVWGGDKSCDQYK